MGWGDQAMIAGVSQPMLRGRLTSDGVIATLAEIERRRVSGLLRFRGAEEGEVRLVAGQISADQDERADGQDPVELFLAEEDATFEVHQALPALSVSRGDAQRKEGSLEVHVVADLMNYCERAGLTGLLLFDSDGRSAEVAYDGGQLDAILLGGGAKELHEAFSWDSGRFVIQARNEVPRLEEPDAEEDEDETTPFRTMRRAPNADATGKHFLEVVEFTLADILKEREERRPATRTSPPQPPAPKIKKHSSLPPPKKHETREDQTVRVIYLGGRESRPLAPTPEASPTDANPRKPTPPKTPDTKSSTMNEKSTPATADADEKRTPTVLWVAVVLLAALLALVVLASLPSLD